MARIYNAAGLFNAPNQLYNLLLTNRLELKGHKVILPQRDGFEFSKLSKSLEKFLSPDLVPDAVNRIIYLLDKGKFIGQDSDICIASLDEPVDEGVVDEIGYCIMNEIPIIGFRTDTRAPYGSATNEVGGAHFFPVYSCDKYIISLPNFKTVNDVETHLDNLVFEIDNSIPILLSKNKIRTVLYTKNITAWARNLFSKINDIHSDEGLSEIAQRYSIYKDDIKEIILPEIVRI